jgi:hypothetical protein
VKAAPVLRTGEVDMGASNAWADAAGRWLATRQASDEHDLAAKDLKSTMPKTAKRAFGHGVEIKAAKNGTLRIHDLAATEEGVMVMPADDTRDPPDCVGVTPNEQTSLGKQPVHAAVNPHVSYRTDPRQLILPLENVVAAANSPAGSDHGPTE